MRYSGVIAQIQHAGVHRPVHLDLLEQASSLVAEMLYTCDDVMTTINVPDTLPMDGVLGFLDAVYKRACMVTWSWGLWKATFDVCGFFCATKECYNYLDTQMAKMTTPTIVDHFASAAEVFGTHRDCLPLGWGKFRGVRTRYPGAVAKNPTAFQLLQQPMYRHDVRVLTLPVLRNVLAERRSLGRCHGTYARNKAQALFYLRNDDFDVIRQALGDNTVEDLKNVYKKARDSADRGYNVTVRGSVCDGYYRAPNPQWIAGAVLPACEGVLCHVAGVLAYQAPFGTDRDTALWVHDQLRTLFFKRPPTIEEATTQASTDTI